MKPVKDWHIIKTDDGYYRCVNHDEKLLSTGFLTEEKMKEYSCHILLTTRVKNLMAIRYAETFK